jgi:predicted nucleotidyltransferase
MHNEKNTMKKRNIDMPEEKIAEFCQRHHIRRLALFGSALREDFTPNSDVDVLVEFEPGTRVGMIRLAGIELELSRILGRKVDMNTPGFISKYYREEVLAEAEDQYVAA